MPPRKRNTKKPSPKQLAARKKFAEKVQVAKEIQKKNPNMTWKACLKKAFR